MLDFNLYGYKDFSFHFLNSITCNAVKSRRRRQHENIHQNHEDLCQRLFNAIEQDSYIQPHRHSLDPKVETLIAVRGLFALVIFDNQGNILNVVKFGSEKFSLSDTLGVGVEVAPNVWHTVIALVGGSVLFEFKEGPFKIGAAKETASWAPSEESSEALQYLNQIRQCVIQLSSK